MTSPGNRFQNCKGMTMIELLAVIGILAALAALLFPMGMRMMDRMNETKCASNLRQIGLASALYSGDHSGAWPPNRQGPNAYFSDYLIPYLGRYPGTKEPDFLKSPLICPSGRTDKPNSTYIYKGVYTVSNGENHGRDPSTGKYGMSYAQNAFAAIGSNPTYGVTSRLAVEKSSEMMLYMEMHAHWQATINGRNNADYMELVKKRHNGKVNVSYVDGSLRTIFYDDIPTAVNPLKYFWSGRGAL